MQLTRLDHVNLRTADLARLVAWYGEVLDLRPGPRPPFSFNGAWLYLGDHPTLHLVEVAVAPAETALRLEHFALRATGLQSFVERLTRLNIPHQLGRVPGYGTHTVDLTDPDGTHLHVDFDAEEQLTAGRHE